MTPYWQSFLVSEGAVLGAEGVAHFGQPETERHAALAGDVLVDLSPLAVIRARGPDALGFLDALLSNTVRALDAHHSQLAAWCNAKGRMIALFRLWRRAEDYLLLLPAELREEVLRRLRLFVLRAKVVLDSADEELARLGVSGPHAAQLVREAAGFVAEDPDTVRTQGDVSVLGLPGPTARFVLVAPYGTALALWKSLRAGGAQPVGFEIWTWLDIQAGLPQVYAATREAFVPQMANLDLLGGVSFTKGCYPGQEIVSRLHHRGGLKQRLYRAQVQGGGTVPAPGMPLFAAGPEGMRAAGTVVSAAASPQGGWELLAVVDIASAQSVELRLHSASGPKLVLHPLPSTAGASEG